MRKLEQKTVIKFGFYSPTRQPVELVVDVEPLHEQIELLFQHNQADYVEVFKRYYPVEVK